MQSFYTSKRDKSQKFHEVHLEAHFSTHYCKWKVLKYNVGGWQNKILKQNMKLIVGLLKRTKERSS